MDPIGLILGHSSATRPSPSVLRESPHGTAMPLDQGGTLSRMHRTATTLRAKLSEYIPAKMSIRPAWDFYSPESPIVWRCVVRSPDSGTRHNVARSGYNHHDGVPQKGYYLDSTICASTGGPLRSASIPRIVVSEGGPPGISHRICAEKLRNNAGMIASTPNFRLRSIH